jgi:23S rRNA pseudouridine1911/1915/1917 synthase
MAHNSLDLHLPTPPLPAGGARLDEAPGLPAALPRTEVFTVQKTLPSARLDAYLRDRFPAVSRGAIQRLIEEGEIRVNGQKVKPTHAPHAGESVQVHWPEPRLDRAQPEEMELNILYEDAALLVLNKPAGLVVHPASGHEQHTLVNALLHYCHGQLSGIGGVARPGIVHRLDKETSGCMVIAKNDDTHIALSAQFAARRVEKTYQAIVCGELERDTGEIRAAIGRHPSHRKRMAVNNELGREARTSYQVLRRLRGATLVRVLLHTGRTHQIRVHFQFLGFPLVGDRVYGSRHNLRLTEQTGYSPRRQMLHAMQLCFNHPRTGTRMTFEAPLPEDFKDALEALAA